MRLPWGTILVVVSCLSIGLASAAAASPIDSCGSLENAFGPFDYINPRHRSQHLDVVERFHFADDIYALNANKLGQDIDYTLRAFPNHHRALDAISRLGQREGLPRPSGARYTIECYFERAIRWRPEDPTVRLVYGIHLYRNGQLDDAIKQAERGLELAPNNLELHYNIGLFLTKKGNYAAAREHARRVYGQGYPLPGLRRQLERAGEWSE